MNSLAHLLEVFLVATLIGALFGFMAPLLAPFAFAGTVLLFVAAEARNKRYEDHDNTNWQ